MDHPLQPGDIVRVHLNQGDANGDAGKTFEEQTLHRYLVPVQPSFFRTNALSKSAFA